VKTKMEIKTSKAELILKILDVIESEVDLSVRQDDALIQKLEYMFFTVGGN